MNLSPLFLFFILSSQSIILFSHRVYATFVVLNVTAALHHAQQEYKNYSSLVLTRLNHDAARLSFIHSKLNNNSKNKLQAPVSSDYSKDAPGYVARIGVGKPTKLFDMVIDTGSDLTWLQCKPCIQCYNQSDPIFDPSMSSSYSPIKCGSKHCKDLGIRSSCSSSTYDNICKYTMAYSDSSISKGVLTTEMMSFGNKGSINQFAIGCSHYSKGTFIAIDGLLGLSRGPFSLPSQINASSFSYCLVDRHSNISSTLDFNSPQPDHSLTVPLLTNPVSILKELYFVGLTGISVGGEKVPVPPETFKIQPSTGHGGIFIDSGSTLSYLQRDVYNKVRDVFVAKTQYLRRVKPVVSFETQSLFDTCYDFSLEKIVRVPAVAFETSDGRWWTLPTSGVLYQTDDKGTFCFAFMPAPMPPSVIGNVQQVGTRISIDLANSVVAFSPRSC